MSDLTLPDVRHLATSYNLESVSHIEALEPNVFLLHSPAQSYALKIYESSDRLDAQRYEHWLLLALKEFNLSFQLPLPLRDRHGATFHTTPEGNIWTLAYKLDGERMIPNDPDQAYAVGAALAELHQHLAQVQPLPHPHFLGYSPQERTLLNLRGSLPADPTELGLQDTPEGRHRLKRFGVLAQSLQTPPPIPFGALHWHITHGDFFGGNVLYNGDVVSAVLDFKSARPDYRVREFAETLMRVTNDLGPLFWGTARSMVEGYASILPLTRAEIELVPRFIVEYQVDRVMYYTQQNPQRAALELRIQEDISAFLEVEQNRLDAMLRGVFLGE